MALWKSTQFGRLALITLALILGTVSFIMPKGALGLQEAKPQSESKSPAAPDAGKAAGEAKPQSNSAEISFSKDILALLKDQKCIVCHRGENPSGLDLADDVAYKNLVNVKSHEDAESILVKPGDPDASYFYQKLIGPGKDGTIMPPKGKMDEAELNKIVQWIKQGAKNN